MADNGCGIPPELRPSVFEPLVSTKTRTGTGLGLWVAEGIVRKHRGHIAFRSISTPTNHGTTFSLFLPFGGIQPSSDPVRAIPESSRS